RRGAPYGAARRSAQRSCRDDDLRSDAGQTLARGRHWCARGACVVTKCRASAHGKVILFGEHAVVYGVHALALGIDRGAWAEAATSVTGPSTLHVCGWNITVSDLEDADDALPLARAFRDLLAVTRESVAAGPVHVQAGADLPPGGGLGCSAALGVAVARAID